MRQPLAALLIGWSAGPKGPAFFFLPPGGGGISASHSWQLAAGNWQLATGAPRSAPLLRRQHEEPVRRKAQGSALGQRERLAREVVHVVAGWGA